MLRNIFGSSLHADLRSFKRLSTVEQTKTRDYGNILPKKNELLRIAAVFNADPKVRAFTEYQEV